MTDEQKIKSFCSRNNMRTDKINGSDVLVVLFDPKHTGKVIKFMDSLSADNH